MKQGEEPPAPSRLGPRWPGSNSVTPQQKLRYVDFSWKKPSASGFGHDNGNHSSGCFVGGPLFVVPEGTPSQLRIAATAALEPLKPHDWTQVTGGDPWKDLIADVCHLVWELGIWGIYMIYILGVAQKLVSLVLISMKTTKNTQILAGKKPVNQETYPLSTC